MAHRRAAVQPGTGKRLLRLAGVTAMILGTAGTVVTAAQAGVTQAGVGRAAAGSRLWHPTAFGRDSRVTTAGVTAGPAAGPATASGWQPQPTPNPAGVPDGVLLGESCGAPRSCEAVGDYYDAAGTTVTLAERWTGGDWAIQATPEPAGASGSQLTGVSCPSADACTAVGYDTDSAGVIVPLVETWNGTSWAIQSAPAPAGSSASGFLAVSCTSASACTAVGDNTNPVGQSLPLAERWNGTAWTVQSVPNPKGAEQTGLFAVSCATATACAATGSAAGSDGTTAPLAENWNGTTWTIKAITLPPESSGGELTGVSCTSPRACTATGFAGSSGGGFAAIAERWNGRTWDFQVVPVPPGAGESALSGVSCTSATACTAAGAFLSKAGMPTLAEAWNGTAWKIQPTPALPGARGSQFNAVACTAPSQCTAVGQVAGSAGIARPLGAAEGTQGWTSVVTPAPSGAKSSQLTAVSCPAAADCIAVGEYYRQPGAPAALAERWNGTRWSILPAATPDGATSAYLQSVSCTSPDACTAVGFAFIRGARPALPLAETWDGSSWSIQPVPVPNGASATWLYGVSCSAPGACTAVGYYHNRTGALYGLAERWDGTAWSRQNLGTAARNAQLSGVSCPAAGDCVAVGYQATTGDAQPLALGWNGTSWQAQQVPLPAQAQGGVFSQVSCPTVSTCMATGTVFAVPGGAFAELWSGGTWQPKRAPNPPQAVFSMGAIFLTSVSCTSASSCSAVGNYTPNGRPVAFSDTWDGTAWRGQKINLPAGTVESQLYGVSCTTAGCTAAGWHAGSSEVQVTMALTKRASG